MLHRIAFPKIGSDPLTLPEKYKSLVLGLQNVQHILRHKLPLPTMCLPFRFPPISARTPHSAKNPCSVFRCSLNSRRGTGTSGHSGPLNRLNAKLSLLHPLDHYRTPSAMGSAIGRPYLTLSHSLTGGSSQPPRSKPPRSSSARLWCYSV